MIWFSLESKEMSRSHRQTIDSLVEGWDRQEEQWKFSKNESIPSHYNKPLGKIPESAQIGNSPSLVTVSAPQMEWGRARDHEFMSLSVPRNCVRHWTYHRLNIPSSEVLQNPESLSTAIFITSGKFHISVHVTSHNQKAGAQHIVISKGIKKRLWLSYPLKLW